MENEQMKDIENYEGLYMVSNQGKVYSLISKKFLKPKKGKDGYSRVVLCKDKKGKTYLLHRLVAQAFLENPQNLSDVNHKDENPSNNRVENLEWMSHIENMNYGTRTERAILKILKHPNTCIKQLKPIQQFSKQGEFVAEYPSAREASRQTKINQGDISKCCLGRKYHKTAGGFKWRYKQEEEVA